MAKTAKKTGTGIPQSNFDREFAGITGPDNWNKNAEEPTTRNAGANQSMQDIKRGINFAKKMQGGGDGSPVGMKNPFKKEDRQNAREKFREARAQMKEQLKKQAKAKAREIAFENAGETFGLSILAYEAIVHWKITLGIIGGIILLILMVVSMIVSDNQAAQQQQGQNTPTTNEVCSPAKASNGQTSVCIITVISSGSADNIVITDTILPGTTFVSAGQGGKYDKATNTVTWDAKQLLLQLNPVNITVTVTVRISTKQNNVKVWNAYAINPTNLQGGSGSAGGSVPPNNSTCNGKYTLNNPLKNFGDPQCNFNAQSLGTELSHLDPARKYTWDCIARYESAYNPNAYNPGSTSGNGAYGLFQMNPPGKGNGQYDNGGVNWSVQASNAVNYNKGLGGSFGYWGTYYTHGGPCH